jgi:MscS family membrane protein
VVTTLRLLVVVVFALLLLRTLFNVNVTSALAGLGIAGLAVGLAAQESLKNWFGALTIFLARPFAEGDWIIYKGKYGQVRQVNLNATDILLVNGELLTVPNMDFINEPIENASRREYLRREMNLSLPYGMTPGQVDDALQAVRDVLSDEEVRESGGFDNVGIEPQVNFTEFAADHLNVRAYYWFHTPLRDPGWYDFLDHCDLVNRKLFRAFAEQGLSFAFPTQTVRLTDEDDRGLRLNATVTTTDRDASASTSSSEEPGGPDDAPPPQHDRQDG